MAISFSSTTRPPAKARTGVSGLWGVKLGYNPEKEGSCSLEARQVAQGRAFGAALCAGVEGERCTGGSKLSSCRTRAGSLLFLQGVPSLKALGQRCGSPCSALLGTGGAPPQPRLWREARCQADTNPIVWGCTTHSCLHLKHFTCLVPAAKQD